MAVSPLVMNARLIDPSSMNDAMKSPTERMIERTGVKFTTHRAMKIRSASRDGMERIVKVGAPSFSKSAIGQPKKAADAAGYTVTVNLKVDYEKWVPQAVGFYAPGVETWLQSEEENPVAVTGIVPEGIYQVVSYFVELDSEGYEVGNAIVIEENVMVLDNINITIDPESATQLISSKAVGADGAPLRISQYKLVDNGGEEPELEEVVAGNVGNAMTVRNSIYHSEIGELFWTQMSAGMELVNSDDYPDIADIPFAEASALRINPLSENFMVAVSVGATPDNEMTCVDMVCKGASTTRLTNSVSDYMTRDIKVGNTEISAISPYPRNEFPLTLSIHHDYFGKVFSGIDSGNMPAGCSRLNYCDSPGGVSVSDYVAMAEASLEDYISSYSCDTTYDGDWMWISEEKTFTSVYSPKILLAAEMVLNYTDDFYYDFGWCDKSVPASMSLSLGEIAYCMGGSPVYTNIVPTSLYEDEETIVGLIPFSPSTIGYAGEMDGVYANLAVPEIKYNGEPVDYDYEYYSDFWSGGFFGWCYDWNDTNPAPGSYEFKFSSPMIINDYVGEWSAKFAFDQKKGDNIPPAVQYLQIRDGNGNLAFDFEDGSDAALRIMTADFMYDPYCEGRHLQECEPQVMYAPAGSENWTPMQLTKVGEPYYECFGACYEASLGEVNGNAPWGLFSLKVSLVDNSGNSSEQIIAPAFRIGKLVGVKGITSENGHAVYSNGEVRMTDGAVAEMMVYSSDGRIVRTLHGNSMSLNSLPQGVYMVVVREGNHTETLKALVR